MYASIYIYSQMQHIKRLRWEEPSILASIYARWKVDGYSESAFNKTLISRHEYCPIFLLNSNWFLPVFDQFITYIHDPQFINFPPSVSIVYYYYYTYFHSKKEYLKLLHLKFRNILQFSKNSFVFLCFTSVWYGKFIWIINFWVGLFKKINDVTVYYISLNSDKLYLNPDEFLLNLSSFLILCTFLNLWCNNFKVL